MAQQTAVEWLYNTMFEKKGRISKEEFEQAKEMFQQAIETAYNKGTIHGIDYPTDKFPLTGEQYYTQNYKSE